MAASRPGEQPRRHPIDMSSDAIDARLRQLARLHKLGTSLERARRIEPTEDDQQLKTED